MEERHEPEQKVILAIQAHPDDVDFSSGGTVALFAKQGHEVHYLSATSGNKGTHDRDMPPARLGEIRECEQREAAKRLGVVACHFLRHNDGELEVTLSLRREICRVIREVRAYTIMTFDPWRPYQLHPDHRAIGLTALDAVIAARDHLFFPEQLTEGLDIARVHEVYLFGAAEPDTWVDISETIEIKIQAALAHVSQIRDDHERRAERQRARAREIGEPQGLAYAESFKVLHLN
ncbi:MAG TPA: PIG-L deacetylase family protein [Gemmatimonadales bacterium]|nr:PIG-L deacetylase family protein [Gemmatimonadales bacterium]